jgi:signal transduction histidine kinase
VWVTLTAADAGNVELVVGGTAPPIAAAERAAVFQPFSTGGTAGPGLGLWMSQQIVADHGGTIRYDEMGDGGAGFVVRLPVSGPGIDMTAEVTGP